MILAKHRKSIDQTSAGFRCLLLSAIEIIRVLVVAQDLKSIESPILLGKIPI